jgi:hypothetical protein
VRDCAAANLGTCHEEPNYPLLTLGVGTGSEYHGESAARVAKIDDGARGGSSASAVVDPC